MQIAVLGINFKTSGLELREQVTFAPARIPESIQHIREKLPETEVLLLSTCNRTELYLTAHSLESDKKQLIALLEACTGKTLPDQSESHFYIKRNSEALEHLMAVCASLDSMVVGETEILGQVKQAYAMAVETQPDCKLLHQLFQESIRTAKRVHTETSICHGRVSVSSIAVEFAKKVFDDLSTKTAMIVGAGETGELTLKSLIDSGVKNVLVVNRSTNKCKKLAEQYGGTSISFDLLEEHLAMTDIVISSTSAPHCVIKAEAVKHALQQRHDRPIFMIDIAVPRDIESEAGDLDNVYLYDIDDLQKITQENMAKRQDAVSHAWEIVKEEAAVVTELYRDESLPELMKDITDFIEDIKRSEREKILSRESFSTISEKQSAELDEMIDRLANRLMGPTRKNLLEARKNGQWDDYARTVRHLFELNRSEE